jgi:hypothetical protein
VGRDVTCEACAIAARNAHTGHFEAGCEACSARSVSHAPKHLREHYYAKLPPEKREAFAAMVSAEWKRREGWVAKVEQTLSMQRRGTGAGTGQCALAGTVYVDRRPVPDACGSCGKKGSWLRIQLRGDWECSHVACPLRKSLTATESKP